MTQKILTSNSSSSVTVFNDGSKEDKLRLYVGGLPNAASAVAYVEQTEKEHAAEGYGMAFAQLLFTQGSWSADIDFVKTTEAANA